MAPPNISPPVRARVYDVTGAGDMVLAVVALCRTAGMAWDQTIKTANIAAGLEVERLGSTPITPDELEQAIAREEGRANNKLITLDAIAALAASYRREGRTVVFTNGCFDLLHVGHVTCLQEAAEMGDVLIPDQVIGHEVVESYGGQIRVINQTHDVSTTRILQCLAQSR